MTCKNCGRKKRKIAEGCTRHSCIECTEKHLGAAYVLSGEMRDGYPYGLMFIGHLHEAEDESQEFSFLHEYLRKSRKLYQSRGIMPDWWEIQRKINHIRKEFKMADDQKPPEEKIEVVLNPEEKKALVNQAKAGVTAIQQLKSKGAEDVFMEPGNWLVIVELIKTLLGLFGLGRSKEIDATTLSNFSKIIENQNKLLALETTKNNDLKAIREHLEKTCLNEDQARSLFETFEKNISEKTSETTVDKIKRTIPGEMKKYKFGMVRDSE